eukprot:jgi/Botrbrau1/19425/Bobra.0338s0051.1
MTDPKWHDGKDCQESSDASRRSSVSWDGDQEATDENLKISGHLVKEFFIISQIAARVSCQCASSYASSLMAVGFMGRVGRKELSQAVLGTSCYNVTGLSVLLGMTQAIETPAGQAYGARRYAVVGTVLQRMLLMCLVTFAAIQVLWTQMAALLLFTGQPKELVVGAVRFLQLLGPALLFATVNDCLNRYLLVQGISGMQMLAMAVAVGLAPLYMWLFTFNLKLGMVGPALGLIAVQGTALAGVAAYVVWRELSMRGKPNRTWGGWSWDSVTGWGPLLKLALPSIGVVCLEWWLYEGLVLVAGWMPEPSVAVSVMGIGFNTTCFTFSITLGLAAAASTRVANALGAGRPVAARRTAWLAIAMSLVIMTCVWLASFAVRDVWSRLFTTDPEVLEVLGRIFPIIMFSELGTGLNGVCGGVLRGAGRQLWGACLCFISYWVIGLPLIIYIAVPSGPLHWGATGLWIGLSAVTTLQGLAACIAVACINWPREAERSEHLLREHMSSSADLMEPLLVPEA